MGRCGLRADEVNYLSDAELRWSEKGDCWFVELRGKNTRGGEPKLRDAWVPEGVEANVRRFSRERGRSTGERLVDTSKSSVRQWVKEAAGEVADEADQSTRWRAVSSHDLRHSWVIQIQSVLSADNQMFSINTTIARKPRY